MHYDFSADAADVRALLSDAVEIYLHSRGRAPGDHPQVTRVELAVAPGDGTIEPELYVDFDVRPQPEADGDAAFRFVASLHRPQWMERLFFVPEGESLTVTFPDGSSHSPPEGQGTYGEDVDDLVARVLASCLNDAFAAGVFRRVSDPPGPRLTLTYDGNPVWEGPGAV
jgi:hypothetical protein